MCARRGFIRWSDRNATASPAARESCARVTARKHATCAVAARPLRVVIDVSLNDGLKLLHDATVFFVLVQVDVVRLPASAPWLATG